MERVFHRNHDGSVSVSTILNSVANTDDWRVYGKIRRKALLEQDDAIGGTCFSINKKLRISSYFDVADKVCA
jgi:hypothetical protein